MSKRSPASVPPQAPRMPRQRELWGHTVTDDYFWLSESNHPETRPLLEAELRHSVDVLSGQHELEEVLFAELKGRTKETDLSVPVEKDGWSYYSRTTEGDSYPIHCRSIATGGPEQILMDENVTAEGHDYFELGVFELCHDHEMLVWAADLTGDERFSLFIRSISADGAHADLDDRIDGVSYGSAWAKDGKHLFYTTADDANRTNQVWRHRVGDAPSHDVLVFTEGDAGFTCGVGRDADDAHIFIHTGSVTSDEVWVLPSDRPLDQFTCVQPRTPGLEYSATFRGSELVILTNHGCDTFQVMTAPGDNPGIANWVTELSGREEVMLSGMEVFDDYLVLFERTNGIGQIRIRGWEETSSGTRVDYVLEQPEPVYSTWPGVNPSMDSRQLRYGYSSMVSPPSVFLVDMETGVRTLLKQVEVLGGFSTSDYETSREWVESADGTMIPLSLVWKKDRHEGPGPCVIYGYGAYEISTEPVFSTARLLLLDRGYVFAIAHVRGGGELGRAWYETGKFEHKSNSFSDFVACSRHLIRQGWTTSGQLAARGGSAGGLLVGAALNDDPELFGCVVAQVPFVDPLNTILDPSLPLTVGEWEEWGNPAQSEAIYRSMVAYSPYETIAPALMPAVLATTAINDPRVGYWEPAKWVQRLRENNLGSSPILLWPDLDSGHGGPSGRYEAWQEEARILAFVLTHTGIA